jgi:hypothetical protein
MRRINSRFVMSGWLILAIILSACQNANATTRSTPTSQVVATLGPLTLEPISKWNPNLVLYDDMPGNWHIGGRTVDQELDTDSLYYWYFNPELPRESRAGPSENFAVYPTVELAQDHFSSWRDKIIPPDRASHWKEIPEVEFSHHANEMVIACLPASVNAQPFGACAAIARYQNVIVVIEVMYMRTNGLPLKTTVLC